MKLENDIKLAVLIDADNVPSVNLQGMMDEIAKFGVPTIKRIYGDWTSPYIKAWKTPLLEHAITPVQQYSYTQGKNSTDSAMIIDAMDILHSGEVTGFCIVSSDSDFTRLAIRLRESGMLVIGMGEKKTPRPFIAACDKFIYIEIIGDEDNNQDADESNIKKKNSKQIDKIDKKLIKIFKNSVEDVAGDDGWAYLADLGRLINKKMPDFDPRNYGFYKLTPLLRSLNKHFEVEEMRDNEKRIKHIYVRIKKGMFK